MAFLVAGVAPALGRRIQARVGEVVAMRAVLVLRVRGEKRSHARLGLGRERKPEVRVEAVDRLQLAADEVAELDVEDALRGSRPRARTSIVCPRPAASRAVQSAPISCGSMASLARPRR